MDIFIVGPAHPYRGGIAQFNEELAHTFQKEGDRVNIVSFTLQYPSFLFPGKTQFTGSPPPEGLNIERAVNAINPFTWLKAGKRIAAGRPDMAIVRYWTPFMAPALGTVARRIRRNGYTKVIALTDNIVPHEKVLFGRRLTRYFLSAVDGVLYMSRQVGDELDSIGYKGVKSFSPHPIYDCYGEKVDRSAACVELGLSQGNRYVLFFGFIRDYKGLDLLLDAWALLAGNGVAENYKLLVAGEFYGDKEKYTEQIRRNGLEDEVILADRYIPDDKVKYYFSAADLLVQPYRTASQSGVTQIAYNFGLPMIVTDVGGLPEIVPDGKVGYVVERAPEAIAGAILKYITGDDAATFAGNAIREKERFSWHKMTGTFRRMLADLRFAKT